MSEQQLTEAAAALDAAEMALRREEQRAGGPDFMTTRQTCMVAVAAALRKLARRHREEIGAEAPAAAPDPMGVSAWLDALAAEMEASK